MHTSTNILSLAAHKSDTAPSSLFKARMKAAEDFAYTDTLYGNHDVGSFGIWKGTASQTWTRKVCLITASSQKLEALLTVQFNHLDQAQATVSLTTGEIIGQSTVH